MHGLNTYDYGARQYNPVTARWDRMDPLCEKYYSISPYAYCADNPIRLIDPDGRDVLIFYKEKGQDKAFLYNGTQAKVPNNQFVLDFVHTYNYLKSKVAGKNVVSAVKNPKVTIELQQSNTQTIYDSSERKATVFWEPRKGLKLSNGGKQSPAVRLEHEFDHAVDDIKNHKNHNDRRNVYSRDYYNAEEERVIKGSEAETARKLGQGLRYDHMGTDFDVIDPRYIK